MPSVFESLNGNASPLHNALDAGLTNISQAQTIQFTKYVRLVLPLDGYVFWIRASLLSAAALANAAPANAVVANRGQAATFDDVLTVAGSLHYSTDSIQNEDETIDKNHVIFTTSEKVDDMNEIPQNVMYLGEFQGIRFSFNRRSGFYIQAGLYHYTGDAVYPAMSSQIIDDVRQLDTVNVVVSNSLPIWLGLNKLMPVYPSYLVPADIVPPYAAVHIPPESTKAIQSTPRIDSKQDHYQLVSETVKITIYGLRNFNALDFQDYIFQYSLDTDIMGIMNMPVIRDEKRTQSEIQVLGMKKSFELEISYYQTRINNLARQLILSAIPNIIILT
jgi:hypothetical protein